MNGRRQDRWRVTGWRPSREAPLDLEATVERHLRDLCLGFRVAAIVCDPWQFHRSITTLAKDGLPVSEFPQTPSNTVRMGQTLFDLLKGQNLRLYPDDALRAQALHTVAIESSRGFRIAKEKTTKKIDAIVALSMAAVTCLDTPVAARARCW